MLSLSRADVVEPSMCFPRSRAVATAVAVAVAVVNVATMTITITMINIVAMIITSIARPTLTRSGPW